MDRTRARSSTSMNKVESVGVSEGESVKVCGLMVLGSHREERARDDLETLTLAGRTVSQKTFLEAAWAGIQKAPQEATMARIAL